MQHLESVSPFDCSDGIAYILLNIQKEHIADPFISVATSDFQFMIYIKNILPKNQCYVVMQQ